MRNSVIILGTSRKNGNTEILAEKISAYLGCAVINLSDYKITEYDYENKNIGDDFLPLAERMINDYHQVIFATPVYWYSMSGIMKTFFDRLTDLITIKKEMGRKLRGKEVAVVTSSIGNHMEEKFWFPFEQTFEYLGMKLLYTEHFIDAEITEKALSNMSEKLNHNAFSAK